MTHYTKDRGLPGNQVLAMFQDSKGYMWFSTSSGLIKYNGKEYKSFGKKNGLINDWPFDISEDKSGSLWVSFDRGVSRISGNDIKNWTLKNSEDRYSLFADSYNRVWVYSTVFSGDIFCFINDSISNFSLENNFKNQIIINITEDREGGILFVVRSGKIFRYFAGQISELISEGLADAGIRYVFVDSYNNLILCARKGAGVINSRTLYTNPHADWILDKPVNYALQGRNGSYWFAGSEDGIFRLKSISGKDNQVTQLTDQNGLLNNSIKLLYEDYEGNIWFGYDMKGISRLSSLMLSKYGSSEGLNANAILSISENNGTLFCTTENGIFTFKDNFFLRIDNNGKFTDRWFTCMLPLSDSEILTGSVPGIYKLNNNKTISYFGLGKERKIIQALMKDHTGKIWIGTHEGILTLEGSGSFVKQDFDASDKSVAKLLEVNGRDLYIGTDKGLIIVENGTVPHARKNIILPDNKDENSLLSDYVNDFAVDDEKRILAATAKGLAVIKDHKQTEKVEALNDLWVSALFIDSRKRVWAGTTTGVYILRLINGKYEVETNYHQKDGLASDEFTLSNTIFEGKDGKIYLGSFGGLTIYDPSEAISVTVKPRTYISGVNINDISYSPEDASGIELSHRENKISFNCESLSFINEDAVKFEYYLEPVERAWDNSSSLSSISYGYLEPGEYTFHVRSTNQFGIASIPQSVSFVILSPFWKRPWFLVLVVLVLVYTGYQVNYQRQKHIRKRNMELEKLVKEKTEDIEKNKEQIEVQYNQLMEAQKELVQKRDLEKANIELAVANNEIQELKDRLFKENIYLREKQGIIEEAGSIIGNSEAVQLIRSKVTEIAGANSTVLITGGTGVGKNLVAEAIHGLSDRKNHALVTVNCAAIPESLVESELFGHEKGAFTGAAERRIGKFEVADKSTILLDEIGDMNLSVQAKLLNVIQSKKLTRVGGNEEINVDVRIIAATNHDLDRLVSEGKFRQDLYYRINVYTIHIPLLRERSEDIELLAKFFIDKYAKMMNKKISSITKSALKVLFNYHYPGNIRELENIIHRAVIISRDNTIRDEDVLIHPVHQGSGTDTAPGQLITMEEMEYRHIMEVLKHTNWRIRGKGGAAEILSMHHNTLRSRMEKLGIPFASDKLSE
jgi:transcriptional regulator with GAF, ATPase, and Fis domain/ligand-binding sensor domain-containing protein